MTVLEDGVICDVTSDDHIDINPESDEYIALSIDEDFNSFEELDKRDISKLESSEYELITISEGISKLDNSTPVVDSSVENEIVGNMPVLRAVVDGVTDIGFSIFDICDDVALTEAVQEDCAIDIKKLSLDEIGISVEIAADVEYKELSKNLKADDGILLSMLLDKNTFSCELCCSKTLLNDDIVELISALYNTGVL